MPNVDFHRDFLLMQRDEEKTSMLVEFYLNTSWYRTERYSLSVCLSVCLVESPCHVLMYNYRSVKLLGTSLCRGLCVGSNFSPRFDRSCIASTRQIRQVTLLWVTYCSRKSRDITSPDQVFYHPQLRNKETKCVGLRKLSHLHHSLT